jgi:hypothetical protein
MSARKKLWLVPLFAYGLFSFWYTNSSGALTSFEVDQYIGKLQAIGRSEPQLNELRLFLESDTGNQFIMTNNIDMNEHPGHVEGAQANESGDDLMNRYMEHMYPALFVRASHPVFVGGVVHSAMDIVGIQNAEIWNRVVLMRYRSRRDLMDIVTNPEFMGKHDFKVAALTKTIAYPVENEFYISDPRLLLALIVFSFTALCDILFFGRRRLS